MQKILILESTIKRDKFDSLHLLVETLWIDWITKGEKEGFYAGIFAFKATLKKI